MAVWKVIGRDSSPIYHLTSIAPFDERFVIPPMHREEAVSMLQDPYEAKASSGFGFVDGPKRTSNLMI